MRGFLMLSRAGRPQCFIELKNSSLDLVLFILLCKSAIAAISCIVSNVPRIPTFSSSPVRSGNQGRSPSFHAGESLAITAAASCQIRFTWR